MKIVQWRLDIEGDDTDARELFGDTDPQYQEEPTFTPSRTNTVLRDGDDATFVDLGYTTGEYEKAAFGRLVPLAPVPSTPFLWYRVNIRWAWGPGYAAGNRIALALDLAREASDSMSIWTQSSDPADTTTRTSVGRFAPQVDGSTPFTIYEGDFELFSGGIGQGVQWGRGLFVPPDGTPTFARLVGMWPDSPTVFTRAFDVLIETAYDGELPLRQRQRDDHLAPGGVARARGGSSRQGSIRQRGYY